MTTKVSSLDALGYNFWKVRMRAFLQSQGADLWEMIVHPTFVVLQNRAERNTPAIVAQHEANFKAVNILFSGLGPNEYERDGVVPRVATSWSDSELYRL